MSVKQISFSPELLDTPEITPVNLDSDGGCDLTSNADFTQIDYMPNQNPQPINNLLSSNPPPLPMQMGGDMDMDIEATHVNFDSPEQSSLNHDNTTNIDNNITTDINNNNINNNNKTEVNGSNNESLYQMGGSYVDIDNIENETDIEEIEENPDNPGEDPMQMDDAIDENDQEFKEDGMSLTERLSQIRNIEAEMTTEENQQLIKELENTRISDLDFDIKLLSQKLEQEMDLFWDKNLDIAFVERKIEEYIENYESKEYDTYRKMLMYILTKTKMGYKLSITNNGVYILHKGDESKYDIKLTPPKYIDLNIEMGRLNEEIKDITFQLHDIKTELLENAEKIMDDDMNDFRKLQKKYYDLIHKKAIYEGYQKKINKRGDDEVEMFLNFIKRNSNFRNDANYIIDTKYVKVPLDFKNNIQQTKMSSLELFNQIRNKFEKIEGKIKKEEQKELKELITKYLKVGNASVIIGIIEQYHTKQKKSINIIIEKKPIVDVTKAKKTSKK